MSGTKEKLARNWLIKANRDLLSARELAEADIPLLDTAAYHCQQAAEKAIKAFLLFHDVRFEKTHDIEVLILQAIDINPDFRSCHEAASILTPFAVEFRYPGNDMEPEADEYGDAFEVAAGVYQFVLQKLPAVVHP
ncbi:MAG: HEPN domain-containing protein [Kiritimatiellae bacterium]|nr:HEPN domain-containing protein [Verrucomicrobiota bacterium]MBU4291507.1 HEPN domain-containing protein [Verrucomicrobiota bacterium]MCG2678660.1 HEPN domain-containing protein [Kiritimatiellia bacterium]